MIEDPRQHKPEQLAELRILLNAGLDRADSRRPGFFEIDGAAHVYYALRYPFRDKVLLVAAWDCQSDPKTEFVICTTARHKLGGSSPVEKSLSPPIRGSENVLTVEADLFDITINKASRMD